MNGELADALVLARNAERLLLDLAADLVEVRIALVDVQELAPLLELLWRVRRGRVDELEDERPAGDDAGAAREEVAADNPMCASEMGQYGYEAGDGDPEIGGERL